MPRKKPDEDEDQSRRFIAAVREREASGDMNPETEERKFQETFDRFVKPKSPPEA